MNAEPRATVTEHDPDHYKVAVEVVVSKEFYDDEGNIEPLIAALIADDAKRSIYEKIREASL